MASGCFNMANLAFMACSRLVTVQLKVFLACIPPAILSNKRRLRRIYQWMEYTSQLYRYLLPIQRWYLYLNDKQSPNLVLIFRMPLTRWLHSTRYICRLTSIGSLPCGHVFCEQCIGTWLDNENTCPNCRAVITLEDNAWKNGDTSYLPQFC
uniref:RING-type domain-containing protein n=1 Tax=Parascaris equorum TaxID=6256 RepID=A0A914RY12_PAREQ